MRSFLVRIFILISAVFAGVSGGRSYANYYGQKYNQPGQYYQSAYYSQPTYGYGSNAYQPNYYYNQQGRSPYGNYGSSYYGNQYNQNYQYGGYGQQGQSGYGCTATWFGIFRGETRYLCNCGGRVYVRLNSCY